MTNFREIVTKAIIGKCKKTTTANFEVECEETPNTVLGCWVINHVFSGNSNGGRVTLNGSYDVNVWYSYNNDTKTAVCTRKFNYNDIMNVNLKNDTKLDDHSEIIVQCLKQPTVVDVGIKNGIVNLKIEKELGVEVIGNTTVKIAVEDDFDDYEEIFDTENETELNINIDNLDDNYLEDSVNE
ncbi:MAG: outer spore coat protein CotE [Firmicutes bacterium]|nr:outer spore coat protein CotE [Bacillota bacterium]